MKAPRRRANRRVHGRLGAAVVCFLGIVGPSALGAQALPLQSEYPGSGRSPCSAPATSPPASAEAREQAIELTSNSDQALILGDLSQAAALLERAIEVDPASAELAYRHARVLEQIPRTPSAVDEYCRALSLAPDGQIRDAAMRLEALLAEQRAALPAEAVAALESGLRAADRGAMLDALASFELAALRAPQWATAQYNRGVALDWRGRDREAVVALLRYLELRPDAPDVIAVSRRVGQLQSLSTVTGPSPGTAIALGVLFPGMGQLYARRPLAGVAVLSLAGGAVAAGFLVTEVNVRCLTPVETGERCPQSDVISRDTTRPYLTLAIAAGAAVGLIGALEAFLHAQRRRARAPEGFVTRGPRLQGPTVRVRALRVDLSLIALRFR